MPTINQTQDQIIEEFGFFDQWTDKYEYVIELGKGLPALDEQHKTDENLVSGCQSRLWLHAEASRGVIELSAESEAVIAKGVIALLIKVLSGHPAKEIAEAELYFIEQVGLAAHLSPMRSNGLVSMVQQIRDSARAQMRLA